MEHEKEHAHLLLDFEDFHLYQINKIPTRQKIILNIAFVYIGEEVNNILYNTVQSDLIVEVTLYKLRKYVGTENWVAEGGNSLLSLNFDHNQIDWETAKELVKAPTDIETRSTPDMIKGAYDTCNYVYKRFVPPKRQ